MHSKFSFIVSAIAFTALTGCADTSATNGSQNGATPAAGSSGQASAASSANAAPAPAPAPAAQNSMAKLAAAADGTVAEFEPKSIELSAEARANIASLATAAAQAKHVEVTGYCEKQDNEKKAKHLALARAKAVRSELVKDGVPAKIVRIKYVTAEARHSVTVVLK